MVTTLHYAITTSSVTALQLAPDLLAMLTLALMAMGVNLHIDFEQENYYIETRRHFQRDALRIALELAERLGLEPLAEQEHTPHDSPDGRVRIYLALSP